MNSRVKIVYAVNIPFPMPVARSVQIVNTCHALAVRGNNVLLLFGGLGKTKNIKKILKSFYGCSLPDSLTIKIIPSLIADKTRKIRSSWNGVYLFFCVVFLIWLRLTNRYDLLICRELKVARFFLRFRRLIGIPIIFEAHDIASIAQEDAMRRQGSLNKKNKRKIFLLRVVEQYVMRNADAVITVNSIIREMARKEYLTDIPFFVIPNGAIMKNQPFKGVGGSSVYYIGHLYKWKGVDTVIRAMRSIKERLVIVGGKEGSRDFERVRSLAQQEGVLEKIDFVGFVPPSEVSLYRDSARVLLAPNTDIIYNRFFTCPIKLFEYMAAGKPIVASDLPAIREIITDNKNAVLVKPDDPESLAEGINKVLADEEFATRLAKQAYHDAQNYSWDKRGERIEQLWDQLK